MSLKIVFLLWLVVVIVYDFRKRRIPNWLVLSGAVFGLATLALGKQAFGISWSDALLGAACGFGLLLLFYAANLMGAGDVKFAGALGLWVGLLPLGPIWAGASLLAGIHGTLWLFLQRKPWSAGLVSLLSGNSINTSGGGHKRARPIPYAAYLAFATAVWMVLRQQE